MPHAAYWLDHDGALIRSAGPWGTAAAWLTDVWQPKRGRWRAWPARTDLLTQITRERAQAIAGSTADLDQPAA